MAFGFLVGIQLARGLGPAGYGIYGIVMSVVSILAVPVEFGVPSLLTREVASHAATSNWGMVRGVLAWAQKTVLVGFSLLVVFAAIAMLLAQHRVDRDLLLPGAIGLLFIPVVASGNLRSAALRGLQRLVQGDVPEVLVRPAVFSLLLAVATLALSEGLSPTLAISLQVAAAAVSFFIAHHLLRRALPAHFHEVEPLSTPRLWRETALPMAMSEGMRIVQGQVAILFLGLMVPLQDVGLFRVAASMMLLFGMPVTLFNVLVAPVAARLHAQGDRVRLQKLLSWAAIGMSGMVLLLTAPFLVAGAPLLGLVFGEEYSGAATPLAILSLGSCVNACFGSAVVLLNMTGHHNQVTRIFSVSLVFMLLSMPPLIWFFGINGAALATALSFSLFGLVAWHRARQSLKLNTAVFGFLSGRR